MYDSEIQKYYPRSKALIWQPFSLLVLFTDPQSMRLLATVFTLKVVLSEISTTTSPRSQCLPAGSNVRMIPWLHKNPSFLFTSITNGNRETVLQIGRLRDHSEM